MLRYGLMRGGAEKSLRLTTSAACVLKTATGHQFAEKFKHGVLLVGAVGSLALNEISAERGYLRTYKPL